MSHTPGLWTAEEGAWGWAVRIDGGLSSEEAFGRFTEADARLIAAAPDLLAALEEIVNTPAEVEVAGECAYCESKFIARSAIAKAKGEPREIW